MNPVLQQRYAQMQQLMRGQSNADMDAYNAFNKLGGTIFNPGAGAPKDNHQAGDIELTDYKQQAVNNAMGGSVADRFNAMNPEMNSQPAGSVGPLNQANFGIDINKIGSGYGWKPNTNNNFNFNLGGVGYGG